MKKIALRQSLPEERVDPYWINEKLLLVLLKAGGGQYPSAQQLASLGETRSVSETGLFVLGMEKPGEKLIASEPPSNVKLFLVSAFFSTHVTKGTKKNIKDKSMVLACYTIANRWPKYAHMCSVVSKRVVHGNQNMIRALADEKQRACDALMFSAARFGSAIRLAMKFKERMSKVSPIEQLNYLLNESGDDDEARKDLAIARACVLLEDKAFLATGGLNQVVTFFKSDPKMVPRFIEAYLPMPA